MFKSKILLSVSDHHEQHKQIRQQKCRFFCAGVTVVLQQISSDCDLLPRHDMVTGGPLNIGFYEHSNVSSASIKSWEYLVYLSDYETSHEAFCFKSLVK
jgi:hypothetical protein